MLFVVATPIGNLEDITARALRILREVDVVVCEDTRVTRKLLSHYNISAKTESYHANSSETKIEKILDMLDRGKDVALVTDAGTPAISDPGSRMVAMARERFGGAVLIVSVPGPSALTAALSISGLPSSDFLFLGFLPRKKGKKKLFIEIAVSNRTVIFYESPHRIVKTLRELQEFLSKDRSISIAREISKVHEEVLLGNISDLLATFEAQEEKQRGEFVVMVSPGEKKHHTN